MAIRSLLSASRQIRATETYKDTLAELGHANQTAFAAVAEGAAFLGEDIDNARLQLNRIIGKANWFDAPSISLEQLASTGTKKIIIPNQVNAVTFTAGAANLTTITSGIAALQSGTGLGYLYDDAVTPALSSKARVIVRDAVTNMPLVDANENQIFGFMKFDGTDGGSVTGSAGGLLTVKLYTDVNGVVTPATYSGNAEILIPQRVSFSDAPEDFAMINGSFAGAVGSIELGDRMWVTLDPVDGTYKVVGGSNTELAITANDGLTKVINALIPETQKAYDIAQAVKTITGTTLNETSDWALATNLATIWAGDYNGTTGSTFYVNGTTEDDIISAITKLDQSLYMVEQIAKNATPEETVELISSIINEGVAHAIPGAKTYDNTVVDAIAVYVNGQRLVSDIAAGGAGLGDYAMTSTTEVTFNFNIVPGDTIVYEIRKN